MDLKILVFACYTVGIFLIAFKAFRTTHDPAGFLLADRELPGWRAALSAGASDMSGWLLLGLPGLAFVAYQEAFYLALGLTVGTWFNWKFIAAPLRKETIAYDNALTLPRYFSMRYPERAKALRITIALTVLIFYVVYLSAGMVAAAKLFVAFFHLDYFTALTLGATIVTTYTMLGGFRAVADTDALQAVMMITALLGTTLILFRTSFSPNSMPLPVTNTNRETWGVVAVISALAWGLGYPGQPHILARFMATRDNREIRKASRVAISWTIVCLCCAVALGYLASRHPTLGSYAGDPEQIFIVASELVFHPLVAGAVIAAVLAAIMSTADSQLLIAASALYYDLFPRYSAAKPPQTWLRGMRLITALLGAISVLFALNPNNSVLGIVAYAWAGFGASFGPAVILSIYSSKITGSAILLGMLSGAATVILWEIHPLVFPELYSLVPGFIVNLLVVVVSSRIFSRG